jgi:hypothetical protein
MTRRDLALAVLFVLASAPLAAAQAPPASPPARPRSYVGGVADTGQFLPDTTFLASVEDRTITVGQFREAFFNSYAETRPRTNLEGRREFLESMINKEVLALTARAIDRPLDFEDRATMREHTERTLSNVTFQRLVADSAEVPPEMLGKAYDQHERMRRLQHIQFAMHDSALARRVRADLVAKRIGWDEAVRRYSKAAGDSGPGGLWGWTRRERVTPDIGFPVWDLAVGEISMPLRDVEGVHLIRATHEQRVRMPPYNMSAGVLAGQLQPWVTGHRVEALRAQVRRRMGMQYDTTQIVWASSLFGETAGMSRTETGETLINPHGHLPEFAPADTGRVLARWNGGQFTLGGFLARFNAVPPLQRQNVNNFDDFRGAIDTFVMDPVMAEIARERGLENDPLTKRLIDRRLEQIRVEHLFEDSVQSRIVVTPKMRRDFYEKHLLQYHSWRNVTFAAILRFTRAGADSVVARLAAGESAASILAADSLNGVFGSIRQIREDEQGTPYYKVLFEELKQGESRVIGPDKQGDYLVLHSIHYDQGRQLSFEEVQSLVDESVQNITAEKLLHDLIARHRPKYRVVARTDLLERVKMADPLLD